MIRGDHSTVNRKHEDGPALRPGSSRAAVVGGNPAWSLEDEVLERFKD